MFDPTTPVVKNLIVLDSEGKRIAVKYFGSDWYEITWTLTHPKDLFAHQSGIICAVCTL